MRTSYRSSPVHPRNHAATRTRMRRVWGAMLSMLMLSSMVGTFAGAAHAAPDDPQYLTVGKTVSKSDLERGEPFTYQIQTTCQEASCLSAELTDELPGELEGYPITGVSSAPETIGHELSWTENGASIEQPATVGADTALKVEFTQDVGHPVGTGLERGNTFTVNLSLKVPDGLAPGDYDGIENTVNTTASNSAPDEDSAVINVSVPQSIGVAATKSWEPAEAGYNPGETSAITLGATNTSNTTVDSLVIQEPQAATDGAEALAGDNPFTITDFTDFTGSTLPDGADTVQLDAYVDQGNGTWAWASGAAAASPALPDGVDPGDVGGLRFTYTGDIEPDANAEIGFDVAQRSTQRATGEELSTDTQRVDNTAGVEAAKEDVGSATDEARASYTVTPAAVAASTNKNIERDRMAAGESAPATISGNNDSAGGVDELRIADLDYFTGDITFGGFTEGITWPKVATGGTVVYHPLGGGTEESVSFADGDVPADPSGKISGFEIVFTATDGGIESGAGADAAFTIDTTEDATGEAPELDTENAVTTTVTAPNGLTGEATDTSGLTLIQPGIDVTLDKTVRPSAEVRPGEAVFTKLESRATTTSDYVTTDTIVVEDAWDNSDGTFWDGFTLSRITPTQVPAGASLTIEAQTTVGDWTRLEDFGPKTSGFYASMTTTEINNALDSEGAGTIGDVTGLRFTFTNDEGLADDTTVTPYFVSTARGELREGGGPTAKDGEVVEYKNTATTTGSGTTEPGNPVVDSAEDAGVGKIIPGEGGPGVTRIDKQWEGTGKDEDEDVEVVPAQSSAEPSTTLRWSVGSGQETVRITDPTNPTTPADTVFEAFDLTAITPIAADDDPFTNGWYLKYDTITDVQLYDGTGWQSVTEPGSGWVENGSFVGYELDAGEQESTTGVRLLLAENTDARKDAADADAAEDVSDPYAPEPGTGVAASRGDRTFDLEWKLRDKDRSSGDWVTEGRTYNTADEGFVDNTVELVGTDADRDTTTSVDNDTIRIQDSGPAVKVAKTVDPRRADDTEHDPSYVPAPGTVDAEDYPTAAWTITGENGAAARASYLRITDPAPCGDSAGTADCQSPGTVDGALADPFTGDRAWLEHNAFDRYDIESLDIGASLAEEVDLSVSTAWLLRYDDGNDSFSTEKTTAEGVNALNAEDLADVVGFSVTFQGTDPGNDGGSITGGNELTIGVESRLRTTIRSTGADQQLGVGKDHDVTNRAFGQSYDPILADGTTSGDRGNAAVTLTGGQINVGPSKSVDPTELIEPTRDSPVTVTLGANQGTDPRGTLSPSEVWLRDDVESSPEFWDAFDFTGLGDIAAPDGADRLDVGVYGDFDGNGPEWVGSGPTEIDDAEVPVAQDQFGKIQGIELTFTRADGKFFSQRLAAPKWTTTAKFTAELRDTYRGSGDPIDMVGTVENTVTVQSVRPNEQSEEKTADAVITLGPGSHRIAVQKEANNGNRSVSAGSNVPWDLTFKNDGSGYLTVTELRDTLPDELIYTGEEDPVFTAQVDGTLSEDVELTVEGDELVFTWPDEGNTMQPGETFNIRLHLELQPGLTSGERATNTMTVSTVEDTDSCSHLGDGETTGAWDEDPRTCGTTDYVTPVSGPNLFTVKGVSGQLDGAYNSTNSDSTCTPTLDATGGEYYRAPCVAHSTLGGTDDWVLRTQNAGTAPVDEITVFDQLPVAGDEMLVSRGDRGSQFRPQLTGAPEVTAPDGAVFALEVTTSEGVCEGTYAGLAGQEPCEQNGEQWQDSDEDTDWSQVSGIRLKVDFTERSRRLAPGEFVDVTFSTINRPATASDPSGAPSDVPATDSLAMNQFGVKYLNKGAAKHSRLAPNAVGTHLRFGAIEIDKDITGPAADYAADEFLADVACSVDGGGEDAVDLDMGNFESVALNADNDFTQRIDGIPTSATCTVTEQGDVGEFGETSRGGSPATLEVTEPVAEGEDVPAAQVATLTNDYQFTGLSLTKNVETEATEGAFGPFDFSLSCEAPMGQSVTFDDDGATELEFTLEDGGTFVAPENTIPVGSACTVIETGTDNADGIAFTGSGVVDNGDNSAILFPGEDPVEIVATNAYEAGTFEVSKVVDGAGGERYGDGPFGFDATCEYGDQTLLEESFELEAGGSKSFGTFPAGTECSVEETTTGGANSTAFDPVDGLVTITGPGEGEQGVGSVSATATNTFNVGSLDIVKEVEGDGAELWGAGPFEAEVACTWVKDGEELDIELPNGGLVELSEANEYQATIDGLIEGASCTVTETDDGNATATAITPVGGAVTIDGSGSDPALVTLTNTFDVTSLNVTKVVEGNLDADGATGPFTVELACTHPVDGEDGIDIPGGALRTLQAPDELDAVYGNLPVGSICELAETETSGADGTSIDVVISSESRTTEGTAAEVDLSATTAPGQAEAIVTNSYDDPVTPPSPDEPGDDVPATGAPVGPIVAGALALLLLGSGLMWVRLRDS